MGQVYWIMEYLKVMLAYCFVTYLWPAVVFEGHLKGKSRTYRFAFCTTVPIILVSTVVLMLGLAHLLYPAVTTALFYGVFLLRLYHCHGPDAQWFRNTRKALIGTMSRKKFISIYLSALRRDMRGRAADWWASTKGKRLEYLLLLAALLYGTLYFSWGALSDCSFGASDEPVHMSWIYALLHGDAFAKGVYPEAMHCMIYLMRTAFGIRLYSIVVFLAGVYVHVILIAAYLFMKELFHWPYTALLALTLFLTVDQTDKDAIFSMARLSWTLPMEYALHTPFLAALFLRRFLKGVLRGEKVTIRLSRPREWKALVQNENLLMFLTSVCVSAAVHFYTTFFVVFFCIAVAIVYFTQIFRRGSFVPLLLTTTLTFLIAAAPMAAAFAIGYQPQGSLTWAMNVIKGEDSNEPREEQIEHQDNISLREKAGEAVQIIYEEGYERYFPGVRARAILSATALILVVCVPFHLIRAIAERVGTARAKRAGNRRKARVLRDYCDGYLIAALLSLILMFVTVMGELGLPELIEPYRTCALSQLLSCIVCASLIDAPFALLAMILPRIPLQLASAALCAGACALVWNAGMFHGTTFNMMMRYRTAVELTEYIINTYPKDQYTIVSTTEEYYQLIDHGFHEELLEFAQRVTDEDYTIPTPYVFLFIEKKPLYFAQYRFVQMPSWLGWEKYAEIFEDIGSQAPLVRNYEISEEAAGMRIRFGAKLSDAAASLTGRTILESKEYRWFQRFRELYPNEGRVIYEDDEFMCYCFVQNKDCLYQLGLITKEEDIAAEQELRENELPEKQP